VVDHLPIIVFASPDLISLQPRASVLETRFSPPLSLITPPPPDQTNQSVFADTPPFFESPFSVFCCDRPSYLRFLAPCYPSPFWPFGANPPKLLEPEIRRLSEETAIFCVVSASPDPVFLPQCRFPSVVGKSYVVLMEFFFFRGLSCLFRPFGQSTSFCKALGCSGLKCSDVFSPPHGHPTNAPVFYRYLLTACSARPQPADGQIVYVFWGL